jgi:hypothetical protein
MRYVLSAGLLVIVLSGCAPINTEFSCNATAGDQCLSIEEVNEMTKQHTKALRASSCMTCEKQPRLLRKRTQSIWIPPMVDAKGEAHHANVVIADLDNNQIIA